MQFQGILIDGLDENFFPSTVNKNINSSELKDNIIPLKFFLNPGQGIFDEESPSEAFRQYLMSPFYLRDKISFLNTIKGSANPNVAHEIKGECPSSLQNSIYLSILEPGKTLKDSKRIAEFKPEDRFTKEGESDKEFFEMILNYNFENVTEVIFWHEMGNNIEEIMGSLGSFHATITPISVPFNSFVYLIKNDVSFDKTYGDNPSTDETPVKLNVEGKCPKAQEKYTINLQILPLLADDFDPNESFYIPNESETYDNLSNDQRLFNINKGLYLYENNQMENEEDFVVFSKSLMTYNGDDNGTFSFDPAVLENHLNANASSYFINDASWGESFESDGVTHIKKRLLIWANLPEGTGPVAVEENKNIYFTIEEIQGKGQYNEALDDPSSGIFWTPVCLAGNTLITMANNIKKRLDEIQAGDYVLSDNGQPDIVLEIKRNSFNFYHTLYYFENNIIIDETHDHRFYNKTQGFYQKLKNWNIGDIAIDENGNEIRLLKKEKIDEIIENFGLYTQRGTYYANSLLSGAVKNNKKILEETSLDHGLKILNSLSNFNLSKIMNFKEV